MSRMETGVLDRMREADPVDVARLRDELDEAALVQVERRVAQRLEHGAAARGAACPRRRPLVALGALGAAALVATLVGAPLGDDSARNRSPLAVAAALAADQPSTVPVTGEFSYLRLRTGSTESSAAGERELGGGQREWWVGVDGSGRLVQSLTGLPDNAGPPGVHYEARPAGPDWRERGPGRWSRDRRFGAGEFADIYRVESPAVVAFDPTRLPHDPAELEADLRRMLRDDDRETGFKRGLAGEDAQLLTLIGQVLAHPLASPQLRSALYTVVGHVPGVITRTGVRDPAGRRGMAMSVSERIHGSSNTYEVIFDPQTSETLATLFVSRELDPAGVRHRFVQYDVYLKRGVVDSPAARP